NGDTADALTADQAQIQAAGQGFVADANDVSGNNVPLGGGTYVGTSTTVAGVAHGTIPVGGTASGSPGPVAQGGGGQGGNQGSGGHGHGQSGTQVAAGGGDDDQGGGGQADPWHAGSGHSGGH